MKFRTFIAGLFEVAGILVGGLGLGTAGTFLLISKRVKN